MLNGPTQLLCDYKKESLLAFKNLFSFHVFICSLHLFIYILVYIPWDKQWDIYSHPVVVPEPDSGGLPPDAKKLGLKYFLEVFLARDFLEGWIGSLTVKPTLQEKCKRLIQYAIRDA